MSKKHAKQILIAHTAEIAFKMLSLKAITLLLGTGRAV
jgi:hypothetical protein